MQVKKICLLGDFGVGKTSLVRRFVRQQFSDQYHSTIGVKVDTKELVLEVLGPVKLVIWDIAGSETLDTLYKRYLTGAAGYILVADGTRGHTLEGALRLQNQVREAVGQLPWVGLLNKCDLQAEWELDEQRILALNLQQEDRWSRASAKSGEAVEEAFQRLAGMVFG